MKLDNKINFYQFEVTHPKSRKPFSKESIDRINSATQDFYESLFIEAEKEARNKGLDTASKVHVDIVLQKLYKEKRGRKWLLLRDFISLIYKLSGLIVSIISQIRDWF